jgi:ClpP class serine protease
MLYSMKRMYDEEGIDIEVVRASISPNKNLGHPYEKLSDEAREERQGWVDVAGNQFVEQVARGRGIKREDVLKSYGQGRMFFATDALDRGMIDEISNFDTVLSGSGKKKAGMYSQRDNLGLSAKLQSRLKSKLGPLGNKQHNSGAL